MFKNPLYVVHIEGERRWQLTRDFVYGTEVKGPFSGRDITVPSGFVTDLASVPRPLWSLFPPSGKYLEAAVVHDFLYVTEYPPDLIVTKKMADQIFLEAMKSLGISAPIRYVMYLGVRFGGKGRWKDGDV